MSGFGFRILVGFGLILLGSVYSPTGLRVFGYQTSSLLNDKFTVVVFPPFSIPAGSGNLYLNSRGNAGKMRENFMH